MSQPTAKFQFDLPLAPRTTLRLGGPATALAPIHSAAGLEDALAWAASEGLPVGVLGGGSNLLVADRGYRGLLLEAANRDLQIEGEIIHAGAGLPWEDLVRASLQAGLVGLECLAGIPGKVGAAPIQNIGAYGQELAQSCTRVEALALDGSGARTFSAEACGFAYRHSIFKGGEAGRWLITAIELKLRRGAPNPPAYAELARMAPPDADGEKLRELVLGLRAGKGMVLDEADADSRSAGSFFTNPIVSPQLADGLRTEAERFPHWPQVDGKIKLSAAWLLERAGFHKGHGEGPIGLSTKHVLAICHRGGGSSRELVDFATTLRRGVFENSGIALDPEPRPLGFEAGELDELYGPLSD